MPPKASAVPEQPWKAPARATAMPGSVSTEETWSVSDGDSEQSIVLALDEAVVRDRDGMEMLVRLEPPATRETLARRLAELNAEGGVFPVAYPEGGERSEVTRFIVTRDLRVEVPDEAADRIARRGGLAVIDRPEYAPGWVVMAAADPLAALDSLEGLRSEHSVTSADVLLASRQFTRSAPNDPLYAEQWHLKHTASSAPGTDVNIEGLWAYGEPGIGRRGYGIRIGIVDDGLQTDHPDFANNVDTANDRDFNGNDNDPSPGVYDWHGTAVGGVAAARGDNGIGVSGAAPLASLVGLRLIASSPTDHQIANAMNYRNDIIPIKNNSWGPADGENRLGTMGAFTRAAFQNSATTGRGGKGTIFVWAAGNGGQDQDNANYDSYANSIYTIAVGAINSAATKSYYSEPGSNVLVCAPSSGSASQLGITTTDNTGSSGYSSGNYTSTFGGTSSATPLVSGIIALMLEENPELGWRDVQEILIRTAAKIDAADGDWIENGAGFHFNHQYGAGRVDAAAAVQMASDWTNLKPQIFSTHSQSGLNVQIPDNHPEGITRTFEVTGSAMRLEHVTLEVNINHTARGNLEITLTSPGGTVSRLAEVRADSNPNYSNWIFSSVRNWGEDPNGTWTLRIADLSSSGNSAGGQLTVARLRLYGSSTTPVNTAPTVAVTSPESGAILPSGTPLTVQVEASDLDAEGEAGVVTKVELLDHGDVIGTLTAAPYTFQFVPEDGDHVLTARAHDSEGAVGESIPVAISVGNQRPVVLNATLSEERIAYADEALSLAKVETFDYEDETLALTYQWQFSTDQMRFHDAEGEVSDHLAPDPGHTAKLWRCVITASDGERSSEPFTTAQVNLVDRPVVRAMPGDAYDYASGLVLRGSPEPMSRRAIINEFSQGNPSGGSSEWLEILVLQSGGLAGWRLTEGGTNALNFTTGAEWQNVPAGTLIVVYNGNAAKDPFLPADDSDPSDQRMVVSSMDRRFFNDLSNNWLFLADGGDAIFLRDSNHAAVHGVCYGSSTAAALRLEAVGSGRAAYYAGGTDLGANGADDWTPTTALAASAEANPLTGVSPGRPNGPVNEAFVNALRTGSLLRAPLFRLGENSVLPEGLSFEEETGRIYGTVAPSTSPGKYPLVIERYNLDGETASQSFELAVGPLSGFEGWLEDFPELEDATAEGDPDRDGLPNVFEYLLGLDPAVAEESPWTLEAEDGRVSLVASERSREDFAIAAEWSVDLGATAEWSREGIEVERSESEPGVWRVVYALPVTSEHPRRFMRLVAVPVEEE